MTLDAAAIDALLATEKTFAGMAAWVLDDRGTVSKLAVPVLASSFVGSLSFQAHATRFTTPQRGGCVLVCDGRPISRLSIRPDHAHANPFGQAAPATLRGRKLPPGRSRLHDWRDNRAWPRPTGDNLPYAAMVEPEPESFAVAVQLFLAICCIAGALPPAPWEPRLL